MLDYQMALVRGPPISDTLVSALGQSKACPFNGENLRSTLSQRPHPGSPMRPLRKLRAGPWTWREGAWGHTRQWEEESGPVTESSSRLRDVTILVPKFARKCCHRSRCVEDTQPGLQKSHELRRSACPFWSGHSHTVPPSEQKARESPVPNV